MKVLPWLTGLGVLLASIFFRNTITEALKKTALHDWVVRQWVVHIWPRKRKGNDRVFEHLRKNAVVIAQGPPQEDRKEDWVYWPVTLRDMTVIHRAQCSVLRLLRSEGFGICLVLFDCEYRDPKDAESRSTDFRKQAEGIIHGRIDRFVRVSQLCEKQRMRALLSRHAEGVLREAQVNQFMPFLKKAYRDEAEQMRQPVWRFISPAIQCAVLKKLMSGKNVYILGGTDESDMWGFLKNDAQDRLNLSQIAISKLNRPPGRIGDSQIDMKTDARLIRWRNDLALRQALSEYDYPDGGNDTGNLFVWLISHFCCIPDLDDKYTIGAWNFESVGHLFTDLATSEHRATLVDSIVTEIGPKVIG